MFGKSTHLFTILGFRVGVDISWVFLALLVTWSLASGVFPIWYPEFGATARWVIAAVTALGLFLSIIFHELSHSLVARRYGMPISGITLFIFGGVAQMEDEPPSAKAEVLMAAAGPLASYVLGGIFWALLIAAQGLDLPLEIQAPLRYLALINAVLATFNLLPAFPLDGGRVTRALIWHFGKSLRRATEIASRIGRGFGLGFIFLGIFAAITGNLGGLWWALIGGFLFMAARSSVFQAEVRETLSGEPVRNFMTPDPDTVAPDMTVPTLVDDHVYRTGHDTYPVVKNGRLVGAVTMDQLKRSNSRHWESLTVEDIMAEIGESNAIAPGADAFEALSRMQKGGPSRLLVVDDGKLVGILALKDLLRRLRLKSQLEDD